MEIIVLNEYDEISIIKIQKGLLKYKAINNPFPITFTTVFMFKTFKIINEGNTYVGIIISSGDAVTLAMIKPKF